MPPAARSARPIAPASGLARKHLPKPKKVLEIVIYILRVTKRSHAITSTYMISYGFHEWLNVRIVSEFCIGISSAGEDW